MFFVLLYFLLSQLELELHDEQQSEQHGGSLFCMTLLHWR